MTDLKIAHIITGLGGGGAERTLYKLLQGTCSVRPEIVVSLSDEGIYGQQIRDLGVRLECLNLKSAVHLPYGWYRLVSLIRESGASVVQSWMYHADLIGGLAAQFARIPICWGIRAGNLDRNYNKASTLAVVRASALLSRRIPELIICNSEAAIKLHRAFGYADKFRCVPNGFDFEVWRPIQGARQSVCSELGLSGEVKIIGHVGRADPLKAHQALLDAFALVAVRRADVHLLLVGAGLEQGQVYLDDLLRGFPFVERVHGLGRREDISRLMSSMDAFVLSSVGEAFPNVVAEAMGCGTPCVVTDVGDAAQIVGPTGWVSPPSRVEWLAQNLDAAISESAEARARRGSEARTRVVSRYGFGQMITGFEEAWDNCFRAANSGVGDNGRCAV